MRIPDQLEAIFNSCMDMYEGIQDAGVLQPRILLWSMLRPKQPGNRLVLDMRIDNCSIPVQAQLLQYLGRELINRGQALETPVEPIKPL